jgi:hypothetical protein
MEPAISTLDAMRSLAREHGVVCPACRGPLENATSLRCPSCQEELHIGLGLAEPRMGAFITGLIGLSLGLGFNSIVLVMLLVLFVVEPLGRPPAGFQATLYVAAPLLAALTYLWVTRRRRICRWSAGVRWGLAVGTFALFGFGIWCLYMFSE